VALILGAGEICQELRLWLGCQLIENRLRMSVVVFEEVHLLLELMRKVAGDDCWNELG
jgi:hypothetical protein